MNKIDKALKLIKSRIPSHYPEVNVKVYKTTRGLIQAISKEWEEPFKQTADWYTERFKNKTDVTKHYISTKYYRRDMSKNTNTWRDIAMTAGNPIFISYENTKNKTLEHTVYILLHELGHLYNTKSGNYQNEKMADEFAIRWIKVFIKEGLIKNYIK